MTHNNESVVRRIGLSFKFAMAGISFVLLTQRNARIHGLVSLVVLALGFWLRIPALDWAILVLAMMVVWVAEIFNTALETYVDFTSPEKSQPVKVTKDVTAAGVLVGTTGAVIVGLIILGPPLIEKLF
jgi:diacylglycerol kinase (ATP)